MQEAQTDGEFNPNHLLGVKTVPPSVPIKFEFVEFKYSLTPVSYQ